MVNHKLRKNGRLRPLLDILDWNALLSRHEGLIKHKSVTASQGAPFLPISEDFI